MSGQVCYSLELDSVVDASSLADVASDELDSDSDELDSEELSDELDDLEELDDELVAYCDKMLAKLLSLILTLAFSSVSAITWFWKFVSFWYCAIMIFFNSFL